MSIRLIDRDLDSVDGERFGISNVTIRAAGGRFVFDEEENEHTYHRCYTIEHPQGTTEVLLERIKLLLDTEDLNEITALIIQWNQIRMDADAQAFDSIWDSKT